MELLSFSGISPDEDSAIKSLLTDCFKIYLTEEIKDKIRLISLCRIFALMFFIEKNESRILMVD